MIENKNISECFMRTKSAHQGPELHAQYNTKVQKLFHDPNVDLNSSYTFPCMCAYDNFVTYIQVMVHVHDVLALKSNNRVYGSFQKRRWMVVKIMTKLTHPSPISAKDIKLNENAVDKFLKDRSGDYLALQSFDTMLILMSSLWKQH